MPDPGDVQLLGRLPGDAGNTLFGDWTGSVRMLDPGVQFAPTPVGVPCLWCHEIVREGDTGEFMPTLLDHPEVASVRPAHRECSMLGVIGHVYGICRCTDYAGFGDDRRAAALELARRVDAGIPPGVKVDWDGEAHDG